MLTRFWESGVGVDLLSLVALSELGLKTWPWKSYSKMEMVKYLNCHLTWKSLATSIIHAVIHSNTVQCMFSYVHMHKKAFYFFDVLRTNISSKPDGFRIRICSNFGNAESFEDTAAWSFWDKFAQKKITKDYSVPEAKCWDRNTSIAVSWWSLTVEGNSSL